MIAAGIFLGLLLVLAGSATAASAPKVQFFWTADGREVFVQPEDKGKHQYVLYLPGAFKGQDPVIRTDKETPLIWDGTTYENGATLPVSAYVGKSVTFSLSGAKTTETVTVMQGSEIPVLFFNVADSDLKMPKTDIKQPADMIMIRRDGSLEAAEKLTTFKARGNSSSNAPKKPFVFKTENKVNLEGMGKNKTWILLANWYDISLLRNQITMDLCREIGLTSTPDCHPADVYLNGNYNGLYLLSEKIQLKKNRLEIRDLEEAYEEVNGKEAYDKAPFRHGRGKAVLVTKWYGVKEEPEDITGGYLLEIEKPIYFQDDEEYSGFVTDGLMCVTIKEPNHTGKQGVEYISALVDDFHNAAMEKDGISKQTGKYYADYIDMLSFARVICVEEFCSNLDVWAASRFMYKDSDSVDPLLYAGPGWDYDLTYGNKSNGLRKADKVDYVYTRLGHTRYLWHWLLRHEDMQKLTRQVYDEQILPAAEILLGRREAPEGSTMKSIDAYRAEIAASAGMNEMRWKGNKIRGVAEESGSNFEESVAYLKDWIATRTDALTENWQPGQGGKK